MRGTFDQLVYLGVDVKSPVELTPDEHKEVSVTLEPSLAGIRFTARDAENRMLWGYLTSAVIKKEYHTSIAVYPKLQSLIEGALRKGHSPGISSKILSVREELFEFIKLMGKLQDKADAIQDDPNSPESIALRTVVLDISAFIADEQHHSRHATVAGYMVFEPAMTGVRVTARDTSHKLLFGYIACRETFKEPNALVAVYPDLKHMIEDALENTRGLIPEEKGMEDALLLLKFSKLIRDLRIQVEQIEHDPDSSISLVLLGKIREISTFAAYELNRLGA